MREIAKPARREQKSRPDRSGPRGFIDDDELLLKLITVNHSFKGA